MAGYDLRIKTISRFNKETIHFLKFLQKVGRRHHVSFKYKTLGRGRYFIEIDGTPGTKIDAFFQELIINKGLYYYSCATDGNRYKIIHNVIVPVYQSLLESRFEYPHSRSLVKHVLGKISSNKYIPGDLQEVFAHEYEIIFRKWDLNLLSEWDFIKDVDSLLTQFLLTATHHIPGTRSPQFYELIEKAYKQGLGMQEEVKDFFKKIHDARTLGLHRLRSNMSKRQINETAIQIYIYFQYYDEYVESQNETREKLHGPWFNRIKYGEEKWVDEYGEPYKDESGNPIDYVQLTQTPCHDCAAIKGQYHCWGCDVEQCARCKGQRLGCPCKLIKDFD